MMHGQKNIKKEMNVIILNILGLLWLSGPPVYGVFGAFR